MELVALADVDWMHPIGSPTSSSMIDTFCPFGVDQV